MQSSRIDIIPKEDHHKEAGFQFVLAANFYKKAQEYNQLGEYEKSALEVNKAKAHHEKGEFHIKEAVKLNDLDKSYL